MQKADLYDYLAVERTFFAWKWLKERHDLPRIAAEMTFVETLAAKAAE